jgi:HD superfamily phosphohydrolase
MLSLRDPIHGFIRADPLEAALINSRPLQRLRSIRQLGFAHLVFPGAEHSRFSHALGAMELAGRVYDALAPKSQGLLPYTHDARSRRLVRAAALLHDIGHAPFSHSAEDLFEGGIDHEEMTRRLLAVGEVEAAFDRHGHGIEAADVAALLAGQGDDEGRLLCQIVSGELDVDKMDYLLRDSLYCGVRYGTYDLERVLDTLIPIADPETGAWGLGVDEGGIHAIEALVLARYYMFTQVYFNVPGKALELHLNAWLAAEGRRWPSDAERFLREDDTTVTVEMRRSGNVHARAIVEREQFPLAFETREHLRPAEKSAFEALLPRLRDHFAGEPLLVSNASKDPHRLVRSRVWARRHDGSLEPLADASAIMRHMTRIERYRVYAPRGRRDEVGSWLRAAWSRDSAKQQRAPGSGREIL